MGRGRTLPKDRDGEQDEASLSQWSPIVLAPGTDFVEDTFSMDRGWEAWFGDDSSALH